MSSSESDISEIVDNQLSDLESFSCDELTGFGELYRDPVESDYVLVEFKKINSKPNFKNVFMWAKL